MKQLKEYILTENNFFKNLGVGQNAIIKKWIEDNCRIIGNYTINNNMEIDVDGDVYMHDYLESELPGYIQFNKVDGDFYLYGNELKTLRGCPKEVGNDFGCSNSPKLETMKYCPKKVKYNIWCNNCTELKSLDGCPKTVQSLFCDGCTGLTTLKGCPKTIKDTLNCSKCTGLTTIKDGPKTIKGDLICTNTQLSVSDIYKYCSVGGMIYDRDYEG